ncbi:MAG: hypothetical protein EGP96_05080 [Roseburia inulinivorans]|nr:hypothetical protein [Roseburia inulinivorans]
MRGTSPERFLNLCTLAGLNVWQVKKEQENLLFYMEIRDFKRCAPLARKAGVRLHIVEKRGLPVFLWRNRKRKGWAVSFVLFFLLLLFLAQFVWEIDWSGNRRYTESELNHYLQTLQIEEGIPKKRISCARLEEELRELLANKNFFGVEEFAETLNLKAELNELFHMLGSLNVDLNDLKRAKELAASYPRILAAIHNLEELHKVLEVYGIQKYISFELGIISSYQYYTGIIFSGYTFGSGEPIVKGGRYDKLLTYYGKTSASIGFAIVIDQLMAALSRQKINISIETNGELIVYTKANQAKAILSAKEKRAAGTPVETILKDDTKTNEDYQNYAKRNRIRTVTFMED